MSGTNFPWEDDVVRYLAAHPKIFLAFLFGSLAKGKARARSDVDLAVYLSPPYSAEEVTDIWNHLEDIIQRDVDLLVLNDAPPGISWTAMKGKLLVNKHPRLHLELMLERSREAEDFRDFLADFWRERSHRRRDRNDQAVT